MFCVYEAGNGHGNSVPPRGTDVGGVGCPWITHLLCFGTVKTVPGLCEMDQKRPCVKCRKLFEVNGLICVEMDRLMHELCVLT